jgi:tight adherence protein B
MNLNEEIKTIVSQKKQEQKIMTVLPLGIIIVLRFMAADYMEPLYTTVGGRIAMTAAAIVIVCANYISKKIMSIEV